MGVDLSDVFSPSSYVAMIEQQKGAPPPHMSAQGLMAYFYSQPVLNPVKSEGGRMVMVLTSREEDGRTKQAKKIIKDWGCGAELVSVLGRAEGRGYDDYEVEVKGAGRPIFDAEDYIFIAVPGDKDNIIRRPAWAQDFQRFPQQWQKYKSGEKQVLSGTPLEHWPVVQATQVAELRAINVRTVEQLAELNDEAALRSPGLITLKQRAQAWLDAAKEGASSQALITKMKQQEGEIEALRAQLQELIARSGGGSDKPGKAEPTKK